MTNSSLKTIQVHAISQKQISSTNSRALFNANKDRKETAYHRNQTRKLAKN
jgi:hypothetical protein